MAVMRNSIIFGGVDSADFGIYIGGEGTFNAPKRDVEMISIPGRNGAFALDKGRFENIEVTYSAFNFEPDLDTFAKQLSDFRNAICSQKGYQRLTDTFHLEEYRMATYLDGLEIKPVDFNTAATFDIVFNCKPQRYLLSGEEAIDVTSGEVILNPTLFESSPMLEVEGYGTIAFNGYEIELENYELGNIPLAGNKSTPSREWGYDTQTLSSTYSIANLNSGDVETLNGVTLTFGIDVSNYSGFVSAVRSVHISPPASGSFVFGITSTGVGTKYATITLRLTANPTFGAGTPFAREETAFTFGYDTTRPDGTAAGGSEFDCHFFVEKTVTGQSETLTITFEHEAYTLYGEGNYTMSCGNLTGYSTVSLLGHPTYIDCDLGECYRTDNDEYISLNHKIDLGSDLPKLASGENEITYDNTVTDLKLIPRWWKI